MEQSQPIHRIGFIGVGRMGGPMAANLQRAGFTVQVYDVAEAAREAAAGAGLVVTASAS